MYLNENLIDKWELGWNSDMTALIEWDIFLKTLHKNNK